jgi:hypothetical protein
MLVLAVGFLIFTVISMNMQNVVFSDLTPQEKTQVSQIIKKTIQIQMGQQLNVTPQIQSNNGSGYTEMGTVYKDPKTGKLIMIPG